VADPVRPNWQRHTLGERGAGADFGAAHDHHHDLNDNRSATSNNDDRYSAAHDHHDNAARTDDAYCRTS